jgi:hypothetical protein
MAITVEQMRRFVDRADGLAHVLDALLASAGKPPGAEILAAFKYQRSVFGDDVEDMYALLEAAEAAEHEAPRLAAGYRRPRRAEVVAT